LNDREYFGLVRLPEKPDYQAPDSSEIRLLLSMKYGGLCHCTILPNSTTLAGTHKTVEEIWYIIQGQGQVWQKQQDREKVVDVYPGVCLAIPPQTHFQVRNTNSESVCFIIATLPPWPGPQEWVRVVDHWQTQ